MSEYGEFKLKNFVLGQEKILFEKEKMKMAERDFDKSKVMLKEFLHQNVCNVVFEKVDGSLREMKCTLHPDLIPAIIHDSDKPARKTPTENPDVIKVYDLEADGWRSFRYENVIDIAWSITENDKFGLFENKE